MSSDFDPAQLKLLSFDVFGTLISVRESSYGAFERILRAGRPRRCQGVLGSWEERNIELYWEPYRPIQGDLPADSLAETFAAFGIKGDPD